ncbi:MAG: hypothetical protein ACRDQD_17500 [Nocardioidaceae bacterium]
MVSQVSPDRTGLKVRAVAGVLAVLWGYLFFGITDLLVFLQGPEFVADTMLETGWGLLFVFLVAVPLAVVAVTPTIPVTALQQIHLVAAALAAAGVVSLAPAQWVVAAALIGSAQWLAALTGSPTMWLRRPGRWSWLPGAVVLAGVVPGLGYMLASASSARNGEHPITTWGLDHWPVQAALPLAVLACAALAATYPPGWPVPAWCAAVSAGWFGVLAWTHPEVVASVDRPWAVAAVGWGVGFVLTIHWGAAKGPRRRGPAVG